MSSFILDGFFDDNRIFDENLWFFQKIFSLKKFSEKFHIGHVDQILVLSTEF